MPPEDDQTVATPAVEPEDEFSAAFASLASGEGLTPPADTSAAAEAGASSEDDQVSATTPPVEPSAEGDTSAASSTEPSDAPVADESSSAATAEPTVADLQAQLTALQAKLDAAPTATSAPEEEPPVEKPFYTAEEQGVLDRYMQDWPEVHQAEELIRRREYRDLVAYVFDQVQKRYDGVLDYVENRAPQDQLSAINKLVPDYNDVRDLTIAWVDQQPEYLKAAYQRVVQEGTPEEVADLIGRFKKETNYAAPTTASAATGMAPASTASSVAAPAVQPAEPAPAVKKAASKLQVVASTRSEPAAGPDPNDFESAFKEFASGGR